jgi:hypothetical protein
VTTPAPHAGPAETHVVVATDSALRQWAYGPFRTARAAERFAAQRNAAGDRRQYLALPLRPRDAYPEGEIALAIAEARETSEVGR